MEKKLQIWRIIWGAMLMSTVAFFAVAVFAPRLSELAQPLMAPMLGAIGLIEAIVAAVLPDHLRKQALLSKKLEVIAVSASGEGANMFFTQRRSRAKVFADPQKARSAAEVTYGVALILGVALGESITLFGLVLGLLGFSIAYVAPFFVVGWGLIVWRFPTEAKVIEPLERLYDASVPSAERAG